MSILAAHGWPITWKCRFNNLLRSSCFENEATHLEVHNTFFFSETEQFRLELTARKLTGDLNNNLGRNRPSGKTANFFLFFRPRNNSKVAAAK